MHSNISSSLETSLYCLLFFVVPLLVPSPTIPAFELFLYYPNILLLYLYIVHLLLLLISLVTFIQHSFVIALFVDTFYLVIAFGIIVKLLLISILAFYPPEWMHEHIHIPTLLNAIKNFMVRNDKYLLDFMIHHKTF